MGLPDIGGQERLGRLSVGAEHGLGEDLALGQGGRMAESDVGGRREASYYSGASVYGPHGNPRRGVLFLALAVRSSADVEVVASMSRRCEGRTEDAKV